MTLMGKYLTLDGEQIPLEHDTTVRDVKEYYGADSETVLIHRGDDGETTTLTDSDVVLEHLPNKAEATLQAQTEQVDDDYHVIYDNERFFLDPAETAGEFKERIDAGSNDILGFDDGTGLTKVDDNVTLADNVPSGSTVSTLVDGLWG